MLHKKKKKKKKNKNNKTKNKNNLFDTLVKFRFVVKDNAFVSPQSRLMARQVIWQGVGLVHELTWLTFFPTACRDCRDLFDPGTCRC